MSAKTRHLVIGGMTVVIAGSLIVWGVFQIRPHSDPQSSGIGAGRESGALTRHSSEAGDEDVGESRSHSDVRTEGRLQAVPFMKLGCGGECCGKLKTRTALKDTVLLSAPEAGAQVVGKLAAGEAFQDAQSHIKVLRYGKAFVREDVSAEGDSTQDLQVGDELSVVEYQGDGVYSVWAKDFFRTLQMSPPAYEIQDDGETETWVEITLSSGVKGWALAPELDWEWC